MNAALPSTVALNGTVHCCSEERTFTRVIYIVCRQPNCTRKALSGGFLSIEEGEYLFTHAPWQN